MKSKDLDALYAKLMHGCELPPPMHDPAIHGFTTRDLADRWNCDVSTAKHRADAYVRSGKWTRTTVMYRRDSGSRGRTSAYLPKGGKRD